MDIFNKEGITMINKIKAHLLDMLGGVSKDAALHEYAKGMADGVDIAAGTLKGLGKTINGCDADEWCRTMWMTIEHLDKISVDFRKQYLAGGDR